MNSIEKYNKIYFPTTVALLIIFFLLARFTYGLNSIDPEPYSDVWHVISNLGNMDDSPIGFIFFQLWGLTIGIFTIFSIVLINSNLLKYKEMPLIITKRNKEIGKLIHAIRFGTFLLTLSAIGFILMGLIPANTLPIDKFHEISAGLGFGGLVFSSYYHGIAIEKAGNDVNQNARKLYTVMWWLFFGIASIFVLSAELYIKNAYDLGWYDIEWGDAGVPWIFSFPLWERIGFIVGVAYLGIIGYVFPKNK